jgi:tol-pal system protein YbgF
MAGSDYFKKVLWGSLPAILLILSCTPFWSWVRKETNLETLERKVEKIDTLTTKQNQILLGLNADLLTEIESIKQELQTLSAKIDDTQSRLSRFYHKLGVKSEVKESDTTNAQVKPKELLDSDKLYNMAYLDYTQGNYDQAINGFLLYLNNFPNTELSDNAQYWIGECYYSKKLYPDAILAFEKVITNYPNGNKVPAALYKIGACYEILNEYKKARYYYQKVFTEYPQAPEAKLAEEHFKKLP